jgi:SAM-dependent methyltransferase
MEKIKRKPFQGVVNIVRFNWHFYILVLLLILLLLVSRQQAPESVRSLLDGIIILITIPVEISLVVSFYVYDISNLYSFQWMNTLGIESHHSILNIHAGFDETSEIIAARFPASKLSVVDFYDPQKHTEVSIERARKVYPGFPGTQKIETSKTFTAKNSFDYIFLIFAAHEIRDNDERVIFFQQLNDALTSNGVIVVMEHSRDFFNFVAYNLGFFHFWPKAVWLQNFRNANLVVSKEFKHTPFISIYFLKKNGTPP